MKTTIATIVAAITATAAMADPNIDMSQGISRGDLNINLQSQAISGAMIQGNTTGLTTANTRAHNMATASGSFEQSGFLETDNAGAGVGGFGEGEIQGKTEAFTTGSAWAHVGGEAKKKGVSTVAGTFGSADVTVDFDTDWTFKSDDYN